MNYYEHTVKQEKKVNQRVLGDYCLSSRTPTMSIFVLCDGIGSGIYANIAAIVCANRLVELARHEFSFRSACEIVADSMHRARTEEMPFSAFTAVRILNDGNFTIYTYESPNPILISEGTAQVMKPRFYTAGYEIIGESFGTLRENESLFLCSDGVTQAGMGAKYVFGIGANGIADYLNHELAESADWQLKLDKIVELTKKISGGYAADDTSILLIHRRKAVSLTILSGPPEQKNSDQEFVARFMAQEGLHIICGSTTADIVARELKRKVQMVEGSLSLGSPPEYIMQGIEMVTEGAVMLNQVYNIIDEPIAHLTDSTPVERLCKYLLQADSITFMIGNALNDAHTSLLFKQVGVKPRSTTMKLIKEKLEQMGKLVIEENY